MNFKVRFREVYIIQNPNPDDGEFTEYAEEYEVTPKPGAQILRTAKKKLLNDIVINAIPYVDVGNSSGGSTVYIASDLAK